MYVRLLSIVLLLIFFSLTSCSPRILRVVNEPYNSLPDSTYIHVFGVDEPRPEKAIVIGQVEVLEGGLTVDCGYDRVLEIAKAQARSVGGNAIKINEHISPNLWSSCHQLRTEVLLLDTIHMQELLAKVKYTLDSAHTDTALTSIGASNNVRKEKNKYSDVRLFGFGGYSYQVAQIVGGIPNEQRDYFNQLKSGYHYGLNLEYYFSETVGLGATWRTFRSSAGPTTIAIPNESGELEDILFRDDLAIRSFGIHACTRFQSNNEKHLIHLNLGLAYVTYVNQSVINLPLRFTGQTAGLYYDMGYTFRIAKNWELGANISYLIASLGKFQVDNGLNQQTIDLPEDQRESLNRVDLGIQMGYWF